MIFAFTFNTPSRAKSARSALLARQCEVDFQPQEDGSVVLVVVPRTTENRPQVTEARLAMLVKPFGGESLGYGGLDSHRLG